jgi:ATP-dependent Clp protease adaptor protein ClpS
MTPKEKISKKTKKSFKKENLLILHNDDVHSFDYVIDALIDICDHGYEQAEQCTMITHFKGKCDVKKGEFDALKSLKSALNERELIATID